MQITTPTLGHQGHVTKPLLVFETVLVIYVLGQIKFVHYDF